MLKCSTSVIVLATIFGFIVIAKANNETDKFSLGLKQFAVDLLKTLSKPEKNVIISPLSIATALAMYQQITPAKSDLEELEKALHLTAEESKAGFQGTLRSLKDEQGNTTVRLENGCLVKDGIDILSDDLLKTILADFNTKVRKDTFKDLQATVKSINDEIADATNGLITDMLDAGDLENALAVLYSAIYFKATWANKFSGISTEEGSFHINDQKVIKVPIMHESDIKTTCGTDNDLGMQWITLPYEDPSNGPSYSMLLALPLKRFGLDDLIQNITAVKLAEAVSKGYFCEAYVHLPKFKLKEKINAKETLEQLGVRSIFAESKDRPYKVSKILHDAFISVAEEGTEIAAATTLIVHLTAGSNLPTVEFKADQPFLFAVMNNQLKLPLFIGKIANPEWK